jgi:hypothetical protein
MRPRTLRLVRERAGYACEYCGVHENEVGGTLTVDHHRPKFCGGSDDPSNLIYCCHQCNELKGPFWPAEGDIPLWNPRVEPREVHFKEHEDGFLEGTTAVGCLTIRRLRLNRDQLVQQRIAKSDAKKRMLVDRHLREMCEVVEDLMLDGADAEDQRRKLLMEQMSLLREHHWNDD